MKVCSHCREKKSRNKFNRSSKHKDGLQGICKECSSKYCKERYSRLKNEIGPNINEQHNRGKPWTIKELNYLKNNSDLHEEVLAYDLGRSVYSIRKYKRKASQVLN